MNTWRNVWRWSHCLESFVVLALLSLALHTKRRPWKRRWRRSPASFACDEGLPAQKKKNISSRIYPRWGVQIVNYGKHGVHDAWMEISRFFVVVLFCMRRCCLRSSVWNVLPLSKHTRAAVYWCFCFIAMFIDVCVSVWCVSLPLLLGFSAARNGAIRWMEYCHKPPSDHLFTSMHFSWKMKGHERKLWRSLGRLKRKKLWKLWCANQITIN